MADPTISLVTVSDMTRWLSTVGLTTIDANQDALDKAIAEVQSYCGRTFVYSPADAGKDEARTFLGNDEPSLVIDDLLEIASVSVSDGGGTLAEDSYRLEAVGASPYIYLTRCQDYLLNQLYYDQYQPPYQRPLGIWSRGLTITVTGQWGFAATVPADVVEAVCMLAAARQLSGSGWAAGDVESTSVLSVRVQFGSRLQVKRKEALELVRDHRRIEKEPHL